MIGNILISIAFIAAATSGVLYFLNYKGYQNTLNFARIMFHTMATSTILASIFLLYLILTHQFQYKYVYSYSDTSLPLGLLISTFYAGQEGSFLLWALWMAIIGIILQQYASSRGDLEPRVMAVYSLVQSFLLLMITPLVKNPFALIYSEPFMASANTINSQFFNLPFLANYFFTDNSTGMHYVKIDQSLVDALKSAGISLNEFIINGRGLNPLLQNFWMQIHPPILFVGFAAMSVPFSFAFAALMKNDYKEWIKQSLPWTLFAAMVLGLGIMLGGYWAYGVLGWGGYWAWDPVENSSLIPWIISVAALHTMLVQKKTANENSIGAFAKTNLVLIILSFILVLYSTFLTRSGVLGDASVHSFVDPGYFAYLLLLIFMGTFIVLGGGLLIYRWKYLQQITPPHNNILSREFALFTGSVVLGASALVTFLGTSAPILGKSVQIEFYNEMNLPLGILIGLINGLSLLVKWKESEGKELLRKSIFSLTAAVITTVIMYFVGVKDLKMVLFAFASAFAFFVNAEIAYKIFRRNFEKVGAYIAHMGLALLFIGVIASSKYDKSIDVNLVKGEPAEVFGYKMVFTGYSPTEDGKYQFKILIEKNGKKYTAAPVMYYSDFNQGIMRNPDIVPFLTKDIYISPISYDDGTTSNSQAQTVQIKKGESVKIGEAEIEFLSFNMPADAMQKMMSGGDFEIGAKIVVKSYGSKYEVEPKYGIRNGERLNETVKIKDANLQISLASMSADQGMITLQVEPYNQTRNENLTRKEILAVTASIKPFVGLVWLGTVVIVVGFFIAMIRRLKESKV
ncbi:MAG: cytochrome c biogenesis protein CcsA [Ignavibacteria bacterium]|nr:cytochrome c biogenesis protein CcsA [Ignavibacteria bacterium]